MKITSFNPLIIAADPESTVKLFEELGFERRHRKGDMAGREETAGIRMKDANGFCVDIVEAPGVKQDTITIRMNVDDFDAAKKLLESRGFTASPQGMATDSSSKAIGMFSPNGFSFSLVEHIKH
jgi:adenylate cyclase class IV